MSFANETRFPAVPVPMIDEEGRDVLVVIAKATYAIDNNGVAELAPEQRAVRLCDEMRNLDDPRSSVLFPSDLSFAKRGTDVVVVGDAIAQMPVESMEVAVQVRDTLVPLRVHGVRVFFQGALGVVSIGRAQPFSRMPIAYELAFGGMSADLSAVELANPSGVGVAVRTEDLVGQRAPQIEHPGKPHELASDRHPPVGFGAIQTHWSPRRDHVGTMDDRWQKERMPLLPEDFDIAYGNVAHPSLRFDPHLVAGDALGVAGMSPRPISTKVPPLPIEVRARFDGDERAVLRPPIDTVVILPEPRLIEVVARVSVPLGRGDRVLREVVVRNHG